MKTKFIFSLSILTALVLGSCATSNEVANGGLIQKRKFNKGVYYNGNSNVKGSTAKNDEEEFDIFKREERSSKKFVGSTTLHSELKNNEIFESSDVSSLDNSIPITENNVTENTQNSPLITEKVAVVVENSSETVAKLPEENDQLTKNKRKNSSDQNSGSNTDGMFILAVIFAILIPPLGVAIYTNIDWMKVLICFLLTLLFFLPGMIYALLVVFDVI